MLLVEGSSDLILADDLQEHEIIAYRPEVREEEHYFHQRPGYPPPRFAVKKLDRLAFCPEVASGWPCDIDQKGQVQHLTNPPIDSEKVDMLGVGILDTETQSSLDVH